MINGCVRRCARSPHIWRLAAAIIGVLLAAARLPAETPPAPANVISLKQHTDNVYSLVFSADSRLLLSAAGDDRAIVWDVEQRGVRATLQHDAPVYSALFINGDREIVTATGSGEVNWWSVDSGQRIATEHLHQHAVYSLAYQPGAEWIASGGGDTDGGDTTIRIWHARERKVLRELTGHTRPVYGLAFHPTQHELLSASGDRSLRVWSCDDGTFRTWVGHTSDVYRCDYSPDGNRIASGSQDGSLRCWQRGGNGDAAISLRVKQPIYTTKFANSTTIASVADDGFLRLHDSKSLEEMWKQRAAGSALYALAFSHDHRWIAVGGGDGIISLLAPPGKY
ncbi:MAG: WD40 repeat domain-containing protein [Planctomycetales bacterium]|nr:WD40 repeat domain-containing protein [Planctomycetales bacterium]